MPLTLDQFRRAHDAQPGRLPADVVECVVSCFEFYISNAHKSGMTLEKAFGASGASGCDPWWVKLANERRDRYLCDGGAEAGGSIAKQADAVRLAINVYRPTWNRRDQFLAAPPNDDPRTLWLFGAFSQARLAGTDLPDSPAHLRKIISAQVSHPIDEPLLFKTSI
jgi:hypothetical protein